MAPNRTDQAKTNPRESNEREQKKKKKCFSAVESW